MTTKLKIEERILEMCIVLSAKMRGRQIDHGIETGATERRES